MRALGLGVLGIVTGIVAGLVAAEVIGVVGMVLFDRALGIRFLPLYLGAVCGVAFALLDRRAHPGR